MKIYPYYTLPALLLISLSAQADIINWTGSYAGVSLGSSRQPEQYRDMLPDGSNVTIANETARGATAGIHAGYNHQVNQFVFGIEADLEQPNLKNKITPYGRDSWGAKTETLVQGSIRPRIGYSFQRALIYGTTGLTIARFQNEYSNDFTTPEDTDVFKKYKQGWTSGAGIEYLVTDKLSLRGEYRRANFGRITNHAVKVWSGWLDSHKMEQESVRAGISYLFN
jgi:outer membrane immunogenic protein